MQKQAKISNLTVNTDDKGKVTFSAKVQKPCSTKPHGESEVSRDVLVEVVFSDESLEPILQDLIAKAIISIQGSFRKAPSEDAFVAFVENLPVKSKMPFYSVPYADVSKGVFAKDSVAGLAAAAKSKLSKEERQRLVEQLLAADDDSN